MTKKMQSVRNLPSGKWQARRWDAKRRTYVSLGTFTTREDAQKAIDRAGFMEEEGLVPESSITKAKTGLGFKAREPFTKFAERALNARRGAIQRSTFHRYNRVMQTYLVPYFGKRAMADITVHHVEEWWASLEYTPNQRRQAYFLLSRTMKKAVADGVIETNPVHIEASSRDYSKKRPTFTVADVKMMLLVNADPQMGAALWLLMGTGMRVGEMLALNWEDVLIGEGVIDVTKHYSPFGMTEGTKSHRDGRRTLAMPQEATDALVRLYNERKPLPSDPVILTSKNGRQGYYGFRLKFVALRDSVGLNALHIHDLRHIHLTMFGQKATMAELMARAGHTDYRSALRYQHTDAERQRAIVAQLTF